MITFKVETEREDDGRWLAEVLELPGVLAYGDSQDLALSKVQALVLRVMAERLEHGEAGPDMLSRWRKEVRDGVLRGRARRVDLPARTSRYVP